MRALPPHVIAARKRGGPAAGDLRGVTVRHRSIEGAELADRQENLLDCEHYVKRRIRPVAEPVHGLRQRDFDEIRRNRRQLELFPGDLT